MGFRHFGVSHVARSDCGRSCDLLGVQMRTERPMRIASSLVLWAGFSALAMEVGVTDERRTEMSAVVFTGTVTNVQRLPFVRTNIVSGLGGSRVEDLGWWRAEVLVESVTKQDTELGKVAFV